MKVLFVCSGNACRSPLAEALLKKFNPKFEVDSAGTNAYYKIIGITKKYVERENAEQYLKKIPESLDDKHLSEYDLIIAMEPKHKDIVLTKCPECERKIILWNIDDPYFMPIEHVEKIFGQIKEKVKALAYSL